MVTSLELLKDLVAYMKAEGIEEVTLAGTHVKLSPNTNVQNYPDIALPDTAPTLPTEAKDLAMPAHSTKLPDGNAEMDEDEALLFWSVR